MGEQIKSALSSTESAKQHCLFGLRWFQSDLSTTGLCPTDKRQDGLAHYRRWKAPHSKADKTPFVRQSTDTRRTRRRRRIPNGNEQSQARTTMTMADETEIPRRRLPTKRAPIKWEAHNKQAQKGNIIGRLHCRVVFNTTAGNLTGTETLPRHTHCSVMVGWEEEDEQTLFALHRFGDNFARG